MTGDPEPLGVVQGGYKPIQNEELAEMLQAIVDETGAVFDTAGSLRGGREVFMSLQMPEDIQVAGHDAHNLNLVGLNSHDGSRALEGLITFVRVVCANTQYMARQNFTTRYSIRHVSGAKNRIAEARAQLKLTFKAAEGFQHEAEKLIREQLTVDDFRKVCEEIWPKSPDMGMAALGDHHGRWAHLVKLFKEAETQENIRGTRWAGVQAIGEYVDHFIPVRTKKVEAVARADRALFGKGAQIKAKALNLLQVG
jgi:phage/plasmid-like protein (TIGR03299 family)